MVEKPLFANVMIEPEQEELLSRLVEAARNVPRERRREFFVSRTFGGDSVDHPGLPSGTMELYFGDIKILANEGLLNLLHESQHEVSFDVAPKGFAYYEYLKERSGEPAQRLQTEIRSYLNSRSFRGRHPLPFEKWTEAQDLLWRSDSEGRLTTVGHLCREATQEFATEFVARYEPSGVDPDVQHVVARVRAVLEQRQEKPASTVKPFLDALITYWGTLSDLIQRQEHGAQKEGEPLVWEDARRIVFQTAAVMFEIDRSMVG